MENLFVNGLLPESHIGLVADDICKESYMTVLISLAAFRTVPPMLPNRTILIRPCNRNSGALS